QLGLARGQRRAAEHELGEPLFSSQRLAWLHLVGFRAGTRPSTRHVADAASVPAPADRAQSGPRTADGATTGPPPRRGKVARDARRVAADAGSLPPRPRRVARDARGLPRDARRLPRDARGLPRDTRGLPRDAVVYAVDENHTPALSTTYTPSIE